MDVQLYRIPKRGGKNRYFAKVPPTPNRTPDPSRRSVSSAEISSSFSKFPAENHSDFTTQRLRRNSLTLPARTNRPRHQKSHINTVVLVFAAVSSDVVEFYLVQNLTADYDVNVRPVSNHTSVVKVYIDLALSQIVDLVIATKSSIPPQNVSGRPRIGVRRPT